MPKGLAIPLLTVFSLLAIGPHAEAQPQAGAGLSIETCSLRDTLLAERESLNLTRLEYDSTWSAALERRLPAILSAEEGSVAGVSVVNLDQHVYDWNKKCFLCRNQTAEQIEEGLLRDSLFVEELQTPAITHLISSAVVLGDSVAAVVCLVERVVEFGGCEETLSDFGSVSLTLTGYAAGSDWLRFVLYKGVEQPEDYAGTELISEAVSPDVSGYFEVTLPTRRFGTGDYRIAVYARSRGSDEFRLATLIPHRSR